MFTHQVHSNQRPLTLNEMVLIHLIVIRPEQGIEPKEMTKLRRESEASLRTALEIPGAILDSAVYELLRLGGKLS